jgi:formylglycine-generating enzyme required for sulfatase activity
VSGKIFVSYRRDDSAAHALGISQYLEREFGRRNVFIDIDMRAGAKFPTTLELRLAECKVLLAVIGPGWVDARDEERHRRLEDPADWVRLEVSRALQRGITVIPVRVGGADLPKRSALPEDLRGLLDHQAVSVTTGGFRNEMAGLARDIREIPSPWSWRRIAAVAGVAAALLLVCGIGLYQLGGSVLVPGRPGATSDQVTPEDSARRAEADRKRVAAEEEAKRKADEEAKRIAEEETRRRGEEEARRKAEEESKSKAEEEARRRAAEDAKRRADEEAQRRAEEEGRRKAAEEAKRKADEEAQRRAEEEARRKAEEEAKRRAEAEARAKPAPGRNLRDRSVDGADCRACPELTVVRGGPFVMGSPAAEPGRNDNEGPQHLVIFAEPIAVSRFPVTRGEFAAFVKAKNYNAPAGCNSWSGSDWTQQNDRSWQLPGFDQNDRHPVVCVSWFDAKAFVDWLSATTGKRYRLLSEAEWEYAARAGSQTAFAFGDDEAALSEFAWYRANADGRTHPVDSKKPNAFGLFDLHGNVRQWCQDNWHGNYRGAPTDGSAWQGGGDVSRRVLRGGSWNSEPSDLRVARRGLSLPEYRYNYVGFRVARPMD